ncbi:MAG: hypothetical protein ACXWRZ_05580 [Bdellovibrio sp.]
MTLVFVLLMGAMTFYSLLEKEETIIAQVNKQSAQIDRNPSSVAKTSAVKVPSSLSQFAEHDLNCGKTTQKKQIVAGSFVQFQGKNCLKNYKDGDVEILNKSNGYTASTLTHGADKYQTDLIQLKNGENEIVIRYHEGSEKTVEEIIFVHSTQI